MSKNDLFKGKKKVYETIPGMGIKKIGLLSYIIEGNKVYETIPGTGSKKIGGPKYKIDK